MQVCRMILVSLSQRLGANNLSVRLNNIDVCVYILEQSYVFRNLMLTFPVQSTPSLPDKMDSEAHKDTLVDCIHILAARWNLTVKEVASASTDVPL